MTAYCTIEDIVERYPRDIVVLAADEVSGERDDQRIAAQIETAAAEIRGILFARYGEAELDRLTPSSLDILKVLSIDIVMYRVALSFARSTERLKDMYDAAIARLEAIAKGSGGLSFLTAPGAGGAGDGTGASGGPGRPLISAPERVFTRDRTSGL